MTIESTTLENFVRLMNGSARLNTPETKATFGAQAREIFEEMAARMHFVKKEIFVLPGGKDRPDQALMRGYLPTGDGIKIVFDGGKMCYQMFDFLPCDQNKRDGRLLRAKYTELLDLDTVCQSLIDRITQPAIDSCDKAKPTTGGSDLRVENGRLAGTLKF